MTVYFYKYSGAPNVAYKTLTGNTSANCNPYEPVDDLNGFIIVSSSYAEYNYVKFTLTGKERKYFITNREAMTGGRFRLYLREDVLSTMISSIEQCNCIVSRNNKYAETDMVDDRLRTLARERISTIYVGSEFNYGPPNYNGLYDYVLVTVG